MYHQTDITNDQRVDLTPYIYITNSTGTSETYLGDAGRLSLQGKQMSSGGEDVVFTFSQTYSFSIGQVLRIRVRRVKVTERTRDNIVSTTYYEKSWRVTSS
jgi:hypothetical protein